MNDEAIYMIALVTIWAALLLAGGAAHWLWLKVMRRLGRANRAHYTEWRKK